MTVKSIPWDRVKWGVARYGKEITIKLELDDEYAAMACFDVLQCDEVVLSLCGERKLVEVDPCSPSAGK